MRVVIFVFPYNSYTEKIAQYEKCIIDKNNNCNQIFHFFVYFFYNFYVKYSTYVYDFNN